MRKSPADRHNICDDLPVPYYLSVFMLLFLLPALFLLLLLAPPKKNRLDIFPGNEKFLHLLPGLTVLCIGRFLATQHLGILLVELSDGRDFRFALTVMSK